MRWLVVPESAPNATNPKGLALQAATSHSLDTAHFKGG